MKTPVINPATEKQIQKIHFLLRRLNLEELDGVNTVNKLTKGRVSDPEHLTFDEADGIINSMYITMGIYYERGILSTHKPVTAAQIKKIHVLLQQKGLMDQKEALLYSFSDGTATSTKHLTCDEAKHLIAFLMDDQAEIQNKQKALVKAVWRLAWDMGIIYGETNEDYQMNKAKLNMFCRQRGTVKKNLTEQNLPELRKTHRQFEAMYTKHKNKVSENERVCIK